MRQYSRDRINRLNAEPNLISSPAYEPQTSGAYQMSPNLAQSINRNTPQVSRALASSRQSNSRSSDFFSVLTSQMQRIDENFSLEWSEETPLQQALNCIIQTINYLESEKHSNLSNLSPVPEDTYRSTNDSLRSKESKLLSEASLLKKEKSVLKAEKEKLSKLKQAFTALQRDLQERKSENELKSSESNKRIEDIKSKLKQELQSIAESKFKIDKETSDLERLKFKLSEFSSEINNSKEDLDQERSKLFEKTLFIEKEKWSIESLKAVLEEKEALNSHLRQKIDQEIKEIELDRTQILKSKIELHTESLKQVDSYKTIEEERLAFENERLALAEERERLLIEEEKFARLVAQYEDVQLRLVEERGNMEKDKSSVKRQRQEVDEAWDQIEACQGSQTGGRKSENEDPALLEQLQGQMERYYKEIEQRKRNIETAQADLRKREEELERKVLEIQNVEYSLMVAKQDLEELSLGTIPELEAQSQNIQAILAELLKKRNEVDHGYSQLMAQKREFERNVNKSRSSADIAKLADELETRAKRIRAKEEVLTDLEDRIAAEKKENLAKALGLQKKQKEFDESTGRKEAEIEAAAKKLEKLQVKLEAAIKLMNVKESELMSMKEIMDEGRDEGRDRLAAEED